MIKIKRYRDIETGKFVSESQAENCRFAGVRIEVEVGNPKPLVKVRKK